MVLLDSKYDNNKFENPTSFIVGHLQPLLFRQRLER